MMGMHLQMRKVKMRSILKYAIKFARVNIYFERDCQKWFCALIIMLSTAVQCPGGGGAYKLFFSKLTRWLFVWRKSGGI